MTSAVLLGTPIYSDANQTYAPTLSGGSWSGSLPLANLQDRRLSKVARSSSAALSSTKFDVDLGVSRGIRLFAIPKHTLSIAALVRLRGNTSNVFAEENLLLYSQTFQNAVWNAGADNLATRVDNFSVAPDGTTTAAKITHSGANNSGIYQSVSASAGQQFTFSAYVRSRSGSTSLTMLMINNALTVVASQTVTLTGSWQRVTLTGTLPVGTTSFFFGFRNDTGDLTQVYDLAEAQLNSGASALSYSVTTSTAITAPTYDSGWVSVFGTIYPTGTIPVGHPSYVTRKITAEELAEQRAAGINYGYVLDLAAHYEARYWRVEIDDTTNSAGYVDLGRLILAAAWEPSINMSYGAKLGYETSSTRTETDGGAAVYNERPRRRNCTFVLEHVPEDEAMVSALDLQKYWGITKQLFFVFDKADTTHMHRRSFLAVMRELSALEFPYRALNSVPVAVVEEL